MEEIKNIEEKLSNNTRMLNAYKNYEKYEVMLFQYNRSKGNGIKLTRNLKDPVKYAANIAKKYNFTRQEYALFCEKVDKLLEENPEINLNDLSCQKGRKVIGDIISDISPNHNFKVTDLDSVAIAKYYGLCEAIYETQNKSPTEVIKVLQNKRVPIPLFENSCKKIEDYEKSHRRELYDRCRKEKSPDIVHITAGALEIGPGEAEECLVAFEKIEGIPYENDFDKRIKIRPEQVSKAVLDKIIMDDRLTDDEKKRLIDEQYNKIEEKNKFIKGSIQKWINSGRSVEDLSKDFMDRNGIVIDTPQTGIDDDREIG